MTSSRSKRRARALGAALAGILAGSTLAGSSQAFAVTTDTSKAVAADEEGSNGCNGPNGCGSEGETETESDAGSK